MSIKKLWGTRTKANAATYVGERGTLFYNEVDGELRLSNGSTPGGLPISVRADLITANSLLPGSDNNSLYGLGDATHRWYDAHIGDGGIFFNGFANRPQLSPYTPGAQVDDIIPAADNGVSLGDADKRFSSIYLGQDGLYLADQTLDTNINITVNEGTLYIAGAENLRLGNLVIEDTTLKSSDPTQDISIGDFNDTGFFYVKRKAQIDNTTFSSTQAMLGINASGTTEPATIFPDTLVQATGRPNKNSRIIQRSYGSTGTVGGDNAYAVWASYVARGSVAAPAAIKANDILARLSANGYGTTTWGSGGARVEFVALENFTDTAKGTKINFWTTPEGQIASQNVASINSVGVVAQGIEFSATGRIQTDAGIPITAKGNALATQVATLGIDGKLDSAQIPSSLSGAVIFKGAWNADTNTPALSNSLPTGLVAGWEYVVTVPGTRDIGDGSQLYVAGDFVIYDGSTWQHIVSANSFTYLKGTTGGHVSVNGNYNTNEVGALVLTTDATPLSNVSTIVSRDGTGNFAANVITANLTGNVTGTVSGNAGTVTNGVYTNGSYSDPSWLTLSKSKVGLSAVENTALSTWAGSSNITTVGTLTNLSVTNKITGSISGNADGSAGSVAAANITGTTLAATVVTSSLTTVGTLGSLTVTNNSSAKHHTSTPVELGSTAVNFNLDLSAGELQRVTVTADVTITVQNPAAGRTTRLILVYSGNRTVTHGIAAGFTNTKSATQAGNNQIHILEFYQFGTTLATDVYLGIM